MSIRHFVAAHTPSGEVIRLTPREAFDKVKAGLALYTDDSLKAIQYTPEHEARGKLGEWRKTASYDPETRSSFMVMQLV